MKYIKNFNTQTEYDTFINSSDFITPNVTYIKNTNSVIYNPKEIEYQYMTIEALEDNLEVTFSKRATIGSLLYCIDNDENWISFNSNTVVSINSGLTISFKGNLYPLQGGSIYDTQGIGTFTISKLCNLKGNCMSLLEDDGLSLVPNNAFELLFLNCTTIKNVSKKFLPALFVGRWSYQYMFMGCTSLLTAPDLPSTTISAGCYIGMFGSCSSLKHAPALPATELKDACYWMMFSGCSELITAPELNAASLPILCYWMMFRNCSKLNRIKMLATNTSGSLCLDDWLLGVSSTGTFIKHPNANLPSGCDGIPENWIVES